MDSGIRNQDLTEENIAKFLLIWNMLRASAIVLHPDIPDEILWKVSSSGSYSAASAYKLQFLGRTRSPFRSLFWKAWAPPRCKFFVWLLLQDRTWCADQLLRRGWPNEYFCPLCTRNLETSMHIVWQCPVAKQIWRRASLWLGCWALNPQAWPEVNSSLGFWEAISSSTTADNAKGAKSLMIMITWEIWLERNKHIFRDEISSVNTTMHLIHLSPDSWRIARAICMQHPLGDPP